MNKHYPLFDKNAKPMSDKQFKEMGLTDDGTRDSNDYDKDKSKS